MTVHWLNSNQIQSLISSQGTWKCFHLISLIIDWVDLLLTRATHWHGAYHDNDQVIMITLSVMTRSDSDSDSHMWTKSQAEAVHLEPFKFSGSMKDHKMIDFSASTSTYISGATHPLWWCQSKSLVLFDTCYFCFPVKLFSSSTSLVPLWSALVREMVIN